MCPLRRKLKVNHKLGIVLRHDDLVSIYSLVFHLMTTFFDMSYILSSDKTLFLKKLTCYNTFIDNTYHFFKGAAMLKAILVEDEHDVRERLAHMLEQIDTEFVLTHRYENGLDAYYDLINDPPDLIITDIRMPYIDGIKLAQLVKEVEPLIKIIFITGYDELDYAKQAIELDVIGYITKPTSLSEFERVIKKAERRIKEEYHLFHTLTELNQFKLQHLPMIRENSLKTLMGMNSLTPSFQKKLNEIGIKLDYPYLLIGVLDLDTSSKDIEDLPLFLLAVKQYLSEHCAYPHELFIYDDRLVILLMGEKPFNVNEVEQAFQLELKRVQRFYNVSLSAGFSEIARPPYHFKRLFEHAHKALEMRQFMGGNTIYFFDNLASHATSEGTIDESELKQLIYLIKYKSFEEVETYLKELKDTVVLPSYFASYYLHISGILNAILQSCEDMAKLYDIYGNGKSIYDKFMNIKTNEEIFDQFLMLIRDIREINENIIDNTIDLNLKLIEDYIRAHFTNSSLTLSDVAEHVNLSAGYISLLLKKKYNMTFVKYLTKLRMEKAAELLSNPQLKIVDVAHQVGYTDPYYFSHSFKKYYNQSPREFRSHEKEK